MHSSVKRQLATATGAAVLALAGCADAPEQRYTVTQATQFAVAASPTDDTLYLDVQGLLWRMPADGGQAVAVSARDDDLRHPRVSPDGKRIAVQSFRRGHWDIVLIDTRTLKRAALTAGPFDARDPAWSATGDTLFFASDEAGNYDIWALTLATGERRQLTTDPGDDFAPTAAGDELVFISTRARAPALYSLALATDSAPVPVTPAAAGTVVAVQLSPDAKQLAYVEAYQRSGFPGVALNRLVVTDRATGAQRIISPAGSDVFSMPPVWLTDSRLLYTADGAVQSVNLDAGTQRSLPLRAELVAARNRYRQRTPLAFSNATLPVLGIVDPILLPDGSAVFTAVGDLWRQSAAGDLTRLTDDAWVERDVAVAADGQTLAYISDAPPGNGMQVWLHDLVTGSREPVTARAAGPRYPTFAPDGAQLAYLDVGPRGTQDFTLRLLDLASRQVRRLRSAPPLWPGRMAWSADSRHLTVAALIGTSNRFAGGRNQLVRIDVAADSARPLDLQGQAPDFGPVARPDGLALALIIDGALWQLPLLPDGQAAGPPTLLLDELVESPAWSADGEQLLALTRHGLEMLPAVTTAARQVRNPQLESVAATGTGRTVLHAGRVFTGAGDDYRYDVDIVIAGDRIASIEPHSPHPPGTRVVDAAGLTVLPGLIDHHVHFEGHKGEIIGRRLLAFGITTVVEPGGLPYESREQFEAWRSGRRAGPRLVYAGPQLDGRAKVFPFATHVTTEQRLRRELARADRLGYGMLKTYTRLAPRLQRTAVTLAHRHGLPIAAHAVLRNIGNGGDRTEHLRGSSRLEYADKQSASLASYADIEQTLMQTRATVTPTVVNQGGFFGYLAQHPGLADNRQYVSLYSAAERNNLAAFARIVARQQPLIAAGLDNAQASIRRLHAGGVRIVAGTDAPIFPYGLSLVIELANYVEAGLSPADALRTATVNAAAELGAATEVGQVAPGMLADLVVVDGDPLTDISAIANVRAVWVNGRAVELETLLPPPAATATR
ncbi:MAG: amidohydrolase family protein [Gammaproteobacteria bacterium]|jgi:Tol biopolymer transport system component/cytosine/adenosine deaminase-related metal-dependent hydrolase|nr:amidohydrolase family protein [Gammaproteobacteria bacterium]